MKKVAEDSGIRGMLRDEYDRCIVLMEQIRLKLIDYPCGNLVIKKVRSKSCVYEYYHLQWRDGSRVLSKHISYQDLPNVKMQIERRNAYQGNLDLLKKRVAYLDSLLKK